MKNDCSEIYDLGWFQRLYDRNEQFSEIIAGSIFDELNPESVLDLGCGSCNFVNRLANKGCEAVAIDGSEHCSEFADEKVQFYQMDLRLPIELNRKFDVVLCFNVAEHIDKEYENILVDNIVRHCGKWLVFSAAPPGVRGKDHVNCRGFMHWIARFDTHKLDIDSRTYRIRRLWKESGIIYHYHETMGMFKNAAL